MYFGLVVLMDHGKIKKYWEDGDLYYDDSGCLPYYHRDLVVNRLYNEAVSFNNLQRVLQEIFGKDVKICQFFPRDGQATIQTEGWRSNWRFTLYWKRPHRNYHSNNGARRGNYRR